jgi:hypothetical protein
VARARAEACLPYTSVGVAHTHSHNLTCPRAPGDGALQAKGLSVIQIFYSVTVTSGTRIRAATSIFT